MATRSTDIQVLSQCPGRWLLQNLYEKEQKPASFFALGSALHETIEDTITDGLDLDQAVFKLHAKLYAWLSDIEGQDVLESSKRGVDTIIEDADRMLKNWFKFVHPDSPKRLAIYDDYDWPPRVEVEFHRRPQDRRFLRPIDTSYPVWGSVDAIFIKPGVPPEVSVADTDDVLVVDWKSSASKQKNSDQLDFYRFGLGLGNVPAIYHNIDRVRAHAVIQEADPYPGDDVVRQRILATEAIKEGILEDNRVKFNPSVLCNYCPVQHVCPNEGDNPKEHLDNLRRMLQYTVPLETIESEAA